VPVDLHIPGCPPSPIVLLKGLLALLETVSAAGPRDGRPT
jgi:NADH:ubiquinone oxidoreductase subunit B-like Fe-S oxidoreductase